MKLVTNLTLTLASAACTLTLESTLKQSSLVLTLDANLKQANLGTNSGDEASEICQV